MNNNTESETTYDYIVKNIFNEINTLQTLAPIKSESYNTRCSDLEVQNYGTDVGTYYIRKVEQKVLIFSIVKKCIQNLDNKRISNILSKYVSTYYIQTYPWMLTST